MSKQILLCVETNKKARTDYLYIVATIKKYYIDDRKIIQRPIFLDSKTKYNAKDKVKEINKAIKEFSGETKVIYFIDVDDYNISAETQTLFDNINMSLCSSIKMLKTCILEVRSGMTKRLKEQKSLNVKS